jgi:subtilase family serine protease
LPDLDITFFTVYEEAGVVKLEFGVSNTGPGDAGRFVVAAFCSERTASQVVDGLAAGSRTMVRLSFDGPREGQAEPAVEVDVRNEIAESNEKNNSSPLNDQGC